MISPNMLTIGTTRDAMVLYKALFRAILTKRLVRDLNIEMAGVLPSLVGVLIGALGAIIGEVPRRAFTHLTIRLGNAVTFKQGKSPYWEVYGHPFRKIVDFVKETLPTGRVILALPTE